MSAIEPFEIVDCVACAMGLPRSAITRPRPEPVGWCIDICARDMAIWLMARHTPINERETALAVGLSCGLKRKRLYESRRIRAEAIERVQRNLEKSSRLRRKIEEIERMIDRIHDERTDAFGVSAGVAA